MDRMVLRYYDGYPNGGLAITFEQNDDSTTCYQCTGLLVIDSTGCNPDLCATAIPEVSKAKRLTVYPNPFADRVHIESPSGELLHQITVCYRYVRESSVAKAYFKSGISLYHSPAALSARYLFY